MKRKEKREVSQWGIEDIAQVNDLTYNVDDSRLMVDRSTHEYDNFAKVAAEELVESLESPLDKSVAKLMMKDLGMSEIARELDEEYRAVYLSTGRIKTKMKIVKEKIENEFKTPEKSRARTRSKVRRQVFYPTVASNKATALSTSAAVDFLHSV